MEPWTTEWKQAELDRLKQEWEACDRCELCNHRTNVVFGAGSPDADMLFVGEAPGEVEDETGDPFVGPSGEVLDMMLDSAEITRNSLYITNLVGCRPPENRQPLRSEKTACWERLATIIYLVDPLLVIPVGLEAFQFLVGSRAKKMESGHGKLFDESVVIPSPPCLVFPRVDENKMTWYVAYDAVPIYHPSAILRTDSWDGQKETWGREGLAKKTMNDVRYANDMVCRLKTAYEKASKFFDKR